MGKKPGVDPTQCIENISRSAKKLFSEKGYSGTSMRDIARDADCSQSMISHHFGSKRELWDGIKQEACDSYMQQVCESNLMASDKSFEDELCGFIDKRMKHFTKEPGIVRMLTWQALEGLKDNKPPKFKKLMKKFIDDISAAQKSGEVRDDIETEILAYVVLATTRVWFQDQKTWILDALGKDHEEGLNDFTLALKKILKGGIFV